MLRLFAIKNNSIVEQPSDGANAETIRQAAWIDAQDPDEAEREQLQLLLHTELPESEDVEEIESSARFFVDAAGIHVHSLFLTQSEGRHVTTTVACILQPQRLITVREVELADFRLLRMRARRGD